MTAVLIFAGRSGLAQQDPGQTQDAAQANGQRSDGQIEMDVVKALDDSQALKNDMITAATIQSQVTLSGTVSSDASKQLAESIVSKVPGVTKVNNHLKVGNPADAQNDQSAQPAPETYPDPNDDNGAPQSAQNQNPPQYAPNGQENAPPQYPQQPNDQPQPGYSQNPPQPGYPPPGLSSAGLRPAAGLSAAASGIFAAVPLSAASASGSPVLHSQRAHHLGPGDGTPGPHDQRSRQ